MSFIQSLSRHMQDGIVAAPLLTAGIGLWGAAMMTFFTKDLPKVIWSSIRARLVTSIEVTSREEEFGALTQWIERQGYSRRFRRLRIHKNELSVGFGRHYFLRGWKLFWIYRGLVENKDGYIEEVRLSYWGRDQSVLRALLADAIREIHRSDQTRIYTVASWDGWNLLTRQTKRPIDSIFLSQRNRTALRSHLDWFVQAKDWYTKFGIPYRTGLCLYGPPGTGKTSLVKAICAQYDLGLYVVDLANMTDKGLKDLVWRVGPRAVILMEDIDTVGASSKRQADTVEESATKEPKVTLGGLLNAVDGIVDSDGRIVVMTTNHIQKIDPALLRPGRVDLSLELGFMNAEMFVEAFKRFYPEFLVPLETSWRPEVTPAQFQRLLFEHHKSAESVLAAVSASKGQQQWRGEDTRGLAAVSSGA